MTGPEVRCTAYWYASQHGLPTGLDYLLQLGLAAARRARWEGIPALYVTEGPFWVHSWPERIWRDTAFLRSGHMQAYRDQPEPDRVFWSYPAPPEDTQAYIDWTYMTQEEDRDAGWGPGQVPWDGDDM